MFAVYIIVVLYFSWTKWVGSQTQFSPWKWTTRQQYWTGQSFTTCITTILASWTFQKKLNRHCKKLLSILVHPLVALMGMRCSNWFNIIRRNYHPSSHHPCPNGILVPIILKAVNSNEHGVLPCLLLFIYLLIHNFPKGLLVVAASAVEFTK